MRSFLPPCIRKHRLGHLHSASRVGRVARFRRLDRLDRLDRLCPAPPPRPTRVLVGALPLGRQMRRTQGPRDDSLSPRAACVCMPEHAYYHAYVTRFTIVTVHTSHWIQGGTCARVGGDSSRALLVIYLAGTTQPGGGVCRGTCSRRGGGHTHN
jgi:hypothetical protein